VFCGWWLIWTVSDLIRISLLRCFDYINMIKIIYEWDLFMNTLPFKRNCELYKLYNYSINMKEGEL